MEISTIRVYTSGSMYWTNWSMIITIQNTAVYYWNQKMLTNLYGHLYAESPLPKFKISDTVVYEIEDLEGEPIIDKF